MINNLLRSFLYIFITVVIAASCANRGAGPQGGPKDTTPPKFVKSKPENGALNYNGNVIDITFNEIIQLDGAFEKVVVSPPQVKAPTYKALGHTVRVTLNDTIKDSTTYTIDFADAIVDNNERNKLDGYSFCFATGDHIDTLKISGFVIDAATLNPIPGIMIGAHNNLSDTAFTKLSFDRISRTNDKGEFTINNLREGNYRIYALADMGNNYRFDNPTEQIAYHDSIFAPTCITTLHSDTTFKPDTTDTTIMVVDTIITHYVSTYQPDSIILRAFTEDNPRQFLSSTSRPERHKIMMIFGAPIDSLPEFSPLDSIPLPEFKLEIKETRDTLIYWLTDTADYAIDTIRFANRHRFTENDTLKWKTDTTQVVYRAPRTNNKKNTTAAAQPTTFQITTNASPKFEIYNPITLSMPIPCVIDTALSFRFEQQKDTSWIAISGVQIEATDSIGLKFRITHKWQESATYRLQLDSALFVAINQQSSDSLSVTLTTKKSEDYSKLILNIMDSTGHELVQIVDNNDKVVREKKCTDGKVIFENMTPGIYFARIVMDNNDNNKWDTGKYVDKLQPEEVFYFPYKLELRAFWDVEEDWNIHEFPLLEQKPKDLKPKTNTNNQNIR